MADDPDNEPPTFNLSGQFTGPTVAGVGNQQHIHGPSLAELQQAHLAALRQERQERAATRRQRQAQVARSELAAVGFAALIGYGMLWGILGTPLLAFAPLPVGAVLCGVLWAITSSGTWTARLRRLGILLLVELGVASAVGVLFHILIWRGHL